MAFLPKTLILLGLALCSSGASAEYVSEADEMFLQQMLDELTGRQNQGPQDDTAYLKDVPSDDEHMYRDRKEGQISVYNYGPSIRDQEYLEHSSLWGHQYVAGGAGEGIQRLKPDGSGRNVQVVKSDAVLPAYCNPPNPCPIGYTADDGCLEDFENTAAFCREFQQQQECMCDTEHMFDCPGSTKEDEVNTLAQQISNEGLVESALNRIADKFGDKEVPVEGQHKSLVAKKFFNKETHQEYTRMLSEKNKDEERKSRAKRFAVFVNDRNHENSTSEEKAKTVPPALKINPYLQGEKLPVVAKKG
ncbi:uncharacterized protein LOC100903263 [Galendromus occidentalis]|uniref:Neuroendocrine protein 7B2 n=1 Tax=Galendromus occidentalis TaxID=34638 RepID=A0AAJ7P9E8_9ACAR|nr:uncharacterized protein LOC100903263 [Galendromus occidentalis]